MKTAIVLLLVAAAFNGGSCNLFSGLVSTIQQSMNFVVETALNTVSIIDNTIETVRDILDLEKVPDDLDSTGDELRNAVIFELFTASNPDTAETIYPDDDGNVANSSFDATNPTIFVIHGWLSSPEKLVTTSIRDAYLSVGNYNIIAVDWRTFSSVTYTIARSRILSVGRYIAKMFDSLVDQGMNINDLTVVGHSLGAHIAGVASRSSTNIVPILIALDPAGPLFYTGNTTARLTKHDAEFVQVIHTCAGSLGFQGNLGDVDIWPNGGSFQSGCYVDPICSHSRAYLYYAESINGSTFYAYHCDDYSKYQDGSCTTNDYTYLGGLKPDTNATGVYYLSTKKSSYFVMD